MAFLPQVTTCSLDTPRRASPAYYAFPVIEILTKVDIGLQDEVNRYWLLKRTRLCNNNRNNQVIKRKPSSLYSLCSCRRADGDNIDHLMYVLAYTTHVQQSCHTLPCWTHALAAPLVITHTHQLQTMSVHDTSNMADQPVHRRAPTSPVPITRTITTADSLDFTILHNIGFFPPTPFLNGTQDQIQKV